LQIKTGTIKDILYEENSLIQAIPGWQSEKFIHSMSLFSMQKPYINVTQDSINTMKRILNVLLKRMALNGLILFLSLFNRIPNGLYLKIII